MSPSETLDDAQLEKVNAFYSDIGSRESWPWIHWSAHPHVIEEINRRIGGDPQRTLEATLATWLRDFGLQLPVARAVSLGCGSGPFERRLMREGIVTRIRGFDVSEAPLQMARRWAQGSGMEGLHYERANLEALEMEPHSLDLAVAQMSLHHIVNLEQTFDRIAQALVPGGLFVFDEYVGPTRFRWTPRQMEVVNALISILPMSIRMTRFGIPKPPIEHQPESFFQNVDPSEAIRSGEIMSTLKERFDVLWARPYGGTILHPMMHELAHKFTAGDPVAEKLLQVSIDVENALMASGDLDSDFIVAIARPK